MPHSSRHSRGRGGAELVDSELGRDGRRRRDRPRRRGTRLRRARTPSAVLRRSTKTCRSGRSRDQHHRGGIADRLHGGSLRGAVTCPVWTSPSDRDAASRASNGCSPRSIRRCRTRCAPRSPRGAVDAARRGHDHRPTSWSTTRGAGRAVSRCALLGPVVNATGVLLHTNLGRAPLGADDARRDGRGERLHQPRVPARAEGVRGSRHEHAGALLATACGAEAGIVVNNNAAAVLLVLATLGARSRGGRVARRARRDRRRLPRPRDPRRDRCAPRRGRHDEPHARCADYERALDRRRRARC